MLKKNYLKGSNWMHSINSPKEPVEDGNISIRKHKNLIKGGIAEQMLRLNRREKSAKSIWAHKIEEIRKHGFKKSLLMVIITIQSIQDFVILKCITKSNEPNQINSIEELDNASYNNGQAITDLNFHERKCTNPPVENNIYFVLLKKQSFSKLCLREKAFRLFQPWHVINLNYYQYPVIFCAYFIDEELISMHNLEELMPNANMKDSLKTNLSPSTEHQKILYSFEENIVLDNEYLFFKYGDILTLTGRVQRIWQFQSNLSKTSSFLSISKPKRLTVLLQTLDSKFHILILSKLRNLHIQEGLCYSFLNATPCRRFDNQREQDLFRILESIRDWQNGQNNCTQNFCYEFSLTKDAKYAEEVEISKPAYYSTLISPLCALKEAVLCSRFSCIARILFSFNGMFYLHDSSLVEETKYVKLKYTIKMELNDIIGSVAYIREALFDGEFLSIDKYSKFVTHNNEVLWNEGLATSSATYNSDIPLIKMQDIALPLNPNSKNFDIVYIKGSIISVDEVGAYTWLQCSRCKQENLVQDINNIIYCEDCCIIADKPILNIKMDVIVEYNSSQATIQLLSSTIKKVMGIQDDKYEMQFSVDDVLGKEVGPLMCAIEASAMQESAKMFYLTEINLLDN